MMREPFFCPGDVDDNGQLTDLTGLMFAEMWDVGWLFICLDIACSVMLWPDLWLRVIFFGNAG
ncbi:hypothetical protein E2M60_23230 [Salmonella enterica subsp. enterica serovar Newport]|nr:hypothetical protein [Salmonella enterica subsp. enterica serovar Newport]